MAIESGSGAYSRFWTSIGFAPCSPSTARRLGATSRSPAPRWSVVGSSSATAIRSFAGKKPRGWLGPGLTETWETPDLLVEEGYEYVCDWVLDDQPVLLR